MARNGALLFSALAILTGCDQPAPKCTTGRAAFAATYTLVSGTGDCAELKGELLNIQPYNGRGKKNEIDYSKISIAIQPQGIGDLLGAGRELADPDSTDTPYGFGAFDSEEPHGDDYCVVPDLTTARVSLAEVPEVADMCPYVPAVPATEVSYQFSNVRVYTTAKALGTKLFADLTYTKDGCTATYRVAAVSPAVSCEVPPPEEPAPEPMEDAEVPEEMADAGEELPGDAGCPDAAVEEPPSEQPPEPVLDEGLCSPNADPAAGRAVGSGLNPDFKIRCDQELHLCVLNEEAPPAR